MRNRSRDTSRVLIAAGDLPDHEAAAKSIAARRKSRKSYNVGANEFGQFAQLFDSERGRL